MLRELVGVLFLLVMLAVIGAFFWLVGCLVVLLFRKTEDWYYDRRKDEEL